MGHCHWLIISTFSLAFCDLANQKPLTYSSELCSFPNFEYVQ